MEASSSGLKSQTLTILTGPFGVNTRADKTYGSPSVRLSVDVTCSVDGEQQSGRETCLKQQVRFDGMRPKPTVQSGAGSAPQDRYRHSVFTIRNYVVNGLSPENGLLADGW